MNTKTPSEVSVSYTDIVNLIDDLYSLTEQEAALGKQIRKITGALCRFGLDVKGMTDLPSNVIRFPSLDEFSATSYHFGRNTSGLTPILASPGISLPENMPDYRLMLQRDGLILLSWDKRNTERGERYTAYWVTSIGIPRFYASKPLNLLDFFSAWPDHKSYAAEDGIEFYGQEAPEYMVHVAPELMMSNPQHKVLRAAHINKLKRQGNMVNFNYKFLLKTEKKRTLPAKKQNNGPRAS